MECTDVGLEAWLFFAIATGLFVAFVVRSRRTQRWLREHPRAAPGFGLTFGLEKMLEERYVWRFRILFGPIPILMWVVSLSAVYCFFHGPDHPPLSR